MLRRDLDYSSRYLLRLSGQQTQLSIGYVVGPYLPEVASCFFAWPPIRPSIRVHGTMLAYAYN